METSFNRRTFVASVAAAGAATAAPAAAQSAEVAQTTTFSVAAPPQYLTLHEIVETAKKKLNPDMWRWISGGADTESTILRNRLALDSFEFMPNVFVDVHDVDTSTTLFGQKLRIPVVIAPIGGVQAIDPDGVLATATAAANFGTIAYGSYPISTPMFDEVLAKVKAPLACNLYLFGDREWLRTIIEQAKRAGCVALGVTADVAVYGRREQDLANRFQPRASTAPRLPTTQAQSDRNRASTTWETIEFIRKQWPGPLYVKGIVNPAMAKRAVDVGANAVHVSNHGGRQLDFAPATISVLPEIVAAVRGHADVIVDSGFVRGTDVVKALAFGAKAVAIGKLQAWALAAGGSAGLTRALEILESEIHTTMALLGTTSVAQITRDVVRPAQPVRLPSVTSAFPYVT